MKKKAKEVKIKFLENSTSQKLDVKDTNPSLYLLDDRFSKDERELLFRLRSRTVLVKGNFPNAYMNNDMLCELCKLFSCTQEHPLQCPELQASLVVDKSIKLNETFLYGTIDQQLTYVKIYQQFWNLRETSLSERNEQTELS